MNTRTLLALVTTGLSMMLMIPTAFASGQPYIAPVRGLNFVIRDSHGVPLPGVTVHAGTDPTLVCSLNYAGQSALPTKVSDNKGRVSFPNLSAGNYYVVFDLGGWYVRQILGPIRVEQDDKLVSPAFPVLLFGIRPDCQDSIC